MSWEENKSLIWRINIWAACQRELGGGKQDGDNLSGNRRSQKIGLIILIDLH